MSRNFKEVLKINERKTVFVIITFLVLYAFIGLLGDILFGSATGNFTQALYKLITFQQLPIFTLVMVGIGVISVLITYKLYDNIMLWGTNYHEVTSSSQNLMEKQLYNIVEEMKISANLSYMPKVYLIQADFMNAFASGYSEKSAMIAMSRGLIEKLNRSEIQAVIAHEMSHIKHMDIKLTLFIGVLSNIMLLVVDWLFHLVAFMPSRKDNRDSGGGGNAMAIAALVIFLLRLLLPLINLFLTLYLSRTREYMADAGAIQLTRDNQSLGTALLKIQNNYQDNKYEDEGISVRAASYIINPLKSFSDVFSTHPSLDKRLKAMKFDYQKEDINEING